MGVIGPVQSHYHEGSPVGKLLDVCLLSICCITFDVLWFYPLLFVHRVAAVLVCTPTFEHETIVRTALQSGSFTILLDEFILLNEPNLVCRW